MSSVAQTDEKRLFEHFVISGLDESKPLEYLTPSVQECGLRNTQPLAPITDITVIFPQEGETLPDGYEIIGSTTLGYAADLNHGSLRIPSCFICFRRSYHKLPIIDIGILDEASGQQLMSDSHVVRTTPFGRSANVNNASRKMLLTYRRAEKDSSKSQFVVTDIKVILENKGEIPPHTYYKIPTDLNKGIVGSNVFICYKKSPGLAKRIAYKPAVLDYFPRTDYSPKMEDFKLAQNVAMFCLPMGAVIECWPAKNKPPNKDFSTFVLTDENGTKFYGSAVTFYEQYNNKLSDEQLEKLEVKNDEEKELEGGTVDDTNSNNDPADDIMFYKNVSICLISRYPFFNSFKRFLYFLHRISTSTGPQSVPIERYISHLMYEVSFPVARRPKVFMQLGAENISFDSPDDSQLPLNGAQLLDSLSSLGSDNLMYLMLLALLEQKILVHSLRQWMLAAVAESVCSLMFPFHWQCPYIPQCPLGLAGVLHAPLPFIAGVDSRYFELYEDPPHDVTCFDLDTATIRYSSARATTKLGMLPKKHAKQLKETLDRILEDVIKKKEQENAQRKRVDYIPLEENLAKQRQKREHELEIRNAFLKFMAGLMKGYQAFLRPIKAAPTDAKATDTGSLFDLDGFLRSREKSSIDFYKRFSSTQSFMRFIEDRSFVSEMNTYNAFFDDCITKIRFAEEDGQKLSDVKLLEQDAAHNYTTNMNLLSAKKTSMVFIPAPEPLINPETGTELQIQYENFPVKLNPDYFQLDRIEKNGRNGEKVPVHYESSRCPAVRTKPEIRSSILAATNAVKTNALNWPKTLLFHSYSLWFMQLESLLNVAPNKKKILRLAFDVLNRMERTEIFPLDQVCFRVLIELCGSCDEPALAVKVLQAMQRAGLEQNAVTYGIYHRAVMGRRWPTMTRQRAIRLWSVLRIMVTAVGMKRFQKIENQTSNDRPDENDPLGAHAVNENNKRDGVEKVSMSPARAKFLNELSSMPFSSDSTPNSNKQSDARSNSWLTGITNSPMLKMIRSTTFESPKSLNNSVDSSSSPSIHSLVSHMKRGYDNVVKDVVHARLREGVNIFVNEVTKLNKSYGSSGMLYDDDDDEYVVDLNDPAYILDTGSTGSILKDEYWMKEVYLQMKRSRERREPEKGEEKRIMEVILSTCTPCPKCQLIIYDDEIMARWGVEDQNLNTTCVHCWKYNQKESNKNEYQFLPNLTVRRKWVNQSSNSWYKVDGLPMSKENTPAKTGTDEEEETLSIVYLSPLVLRRELETLLSTDKEAIKNESLMETHPVIFWNLVYYMKRLGLPSHLYSWIAPRQHIRCVFDLPSQHKDIAPMYFMNPKHEGRFNIDGKIVASMFAWKASQTAFREQNLFKTMQTLVNETRRKTDKGEITIGPHFPIFRDILFFAMDEFGRALNHGIVDSTYEQEWCKLPPKIKEFLPYQDNPPCPITQACRRIFMPLDLY